MGFEGDPAKFADLTGQPMGAIVSLGGCTASFVSPEGLIATNHHCVQGSLQYNSTPQRNLLVDGFLAKTREEELSNGPGSRVFVTVSVKEVTEAITGKIDPKLDDRKRFDLDRAAGEGADGGVRGGRPALPRRRRSSAACGTSRSRSSRSRTSASSTPRRSGIGNFGGETDNWRWPRHTGDLSFYRAYVGKDGKPAAFSKDNVPYQPDALAPGAARGREGGRPRLRGRLPRPHAAPPDLRRGEGDDRVERSRASSRPPQEQIAILEALGKTDQELQIKAAGPRARPQQLAHQPQGPARGPGEGRHPRAEGAEREGARGLDRRRPRPPEGVRRRAPALAALQAEAEKTRERDAAFSRLFMSSSMLERRPLAPTSSPWRGRRRTTWTASPSTRSATGRGSARARSGRSAPSTPGSTRRSSRGRWATRRRCPPTSASPASTSSSASPRG